jgi:hypothetical protein
MTESLGFLIGTGFEVEAQAYATRGAIKEYSTLASHSRRHYNACIVATFFLRIPSRILGYTY